MSFTKPLSTQSCTINKHIFIEIYRKHYKKIICTENSKKNYLNQFASCCNIKHTSDTNYIQTPTGRFLTKLIKVGGSLTWMFILCVRSRILWKYMDRFWNILLSTFHWWSHINFIKICSTLKTKKAIPQDWNTNTSCLDSFFLFKEATALCYWWW